jgi:hypothetical protein
MINNATPSAIADSRPVDVPAAQAGRGRRVVADVTNPALATAVSRLVLQVARVAAA